MKNQHTFKLGELFCGPGGIGLGAKYSKVQSVDGVFDIDLAWATDYDKDTCETYRNNLCHEIPNSVICKDIRKLDFSILKKISGIDSLSFGFPCNDFSIVGEQKGIDGVYGPLYAYCIDALDYFKPKWFLAENVGGLRNANDGKVFEKIIKDMKSKNYKVYSHLYKFDKYGIPQTRHRIIIIGIRTDIDIEFKIPSFKPFEKVDISCFNAITNPPISSDSYNNEFTKQSNTVIERLKYIKPGENAFTADIPDHLRLNVNGAKISQIYKRLDPKKPSYTVTGSGGGGTHVYHWEENRALTNRERARLQTFPDDFVFSGSKESVRKQIGMAVPPVVSKFIIETILKCFARIDYESIPSNLLINEES